MDYRYYSTDSGRAAGWRCDGGGGWSLNGQNITFADLDAAVERGELIKEYGTWVAVGGIMRHWQKA